MANLETRLEKIIALIPEPDTINKLGESAKRATEFLDTSCEKIRALEPDRLSAFVTHFEQLLTVLETTDKLSHVNSLENSVQQSINQVLQTIDIPNLGLIDALDMVPENLQQITAGDIPSQNNTLTSTLKTFSNDIKQCNNELKDLLQTQALSNPGAVIEEILTETIGHIDGLAEEVESLIADITPDFLEEQLQQCMGFFEEINDLAGGLFDDIDDGFSEVESLLSQINTIVEAIKPAIAAFEAIP